MSGNSGFSRHLRLLTPDDFDRVYSAAERRIHLGHLVLLAVANGRDYPRLGMAIPKRQVRSAVQRNRIRRQIRESFRLQQHQLGGLDIVVMARGGADRLDSSRLRAQLEKAWQELAQSCAKS